jgi:cytochrome c biogenesis protein CcmG/thiol:disulfide interchange protein DsbE
MASRQWIAVGCIVGGLALGAAALIRYGSEGTRVEVGAKAPDFEVYDLAAGDSLWLRKHYKGTVTLVNIWATWCIPCKVEMPALQRAYDSLGAQGFKIAAVSIDVESPETVRKFTDEMHLTFDILQDKSGRIQEKYLTTGVPESFLLDRSGTIVRRVIGAHEWDSPLNLALVRRLLQDSAQ